VGGAHIPVLRDEVAEWLQPARGGLFVDCTVGLGGHARALLERGASRLIGLDRDPAALVLAAETLAQWKEHVELVHADYRDLDPVLDARGVTVVSGVVADLGVSSLQLDSDGRGFSFRRDEPLDMRMDTSKGATAAEMLAAIDETTLADVIYRFGEERHSRRIARALVRAREQSPLTRTAQVAEIVRRAQPRQGWQRIDPATRTFQALRIWVNRELDGLDGFLASAARRLDRGARLAVIAFHSLEDRIVKHTFRALAESDDYRVVTKRPVTASAQETVANPRARSAKLRALERAAVENAQAAARGTRGA
jgi:16S rRNA (cytosine1402-N4)-methyltransferase